MNKKEKVPVVTGDVATVEFLHNDKKAGRAICRLDNGMVGFINPNFERFIAPRSVWTVIISEVREKFVYVTPIEKIKSAYENLRDIDKAINGLKPQKVERKRKPQVKYTNV